MRNMLMTRVARACLVLEFQRKHATKLTFIRANFIQRLYENYARSWYHNSMFESKFSVERYAFPECAGNTQGYVGDV